MANQDSKNVGIIGLGYWGKNILRNLYEIGALRIACDSDRRVVDERKGQFPGVNFTVNYDDVLKDDAVNAVAIAAPAAVHYDLAKKVLAAGKDVFIEKPLALKFEQGRELVELAKANKKIIMVGHILQYHPAFIKLRDMVKKGELGKVEYIYSNRLNIGKLRVEENILWSFAPHDISAILMLLEEEPVRVSCFGADYLNENIYDVTLSTLEFKNKVRAHIFVSWLHPFKEQKLVVVGSKTMAVFDDMTKEKLFIYPHKIEWKDGRIPVSQKAESYCVPVDDKEPLKEELLHFIECVSQRKNPRTDGQEGLRVLKVLEEAEKSMMRRGEGATQPAADYFAHPTSVIDENVSIGKGTKIWHFSHILKGSSMGANCVVGQNVSIGPDVKIGNRCKIQNNVSVYKKVVLEDDVFCGPSCVFTNVNNPRAFIERKDEFMPTIVGKGSSVGANATIVCGNKLGRYCFVGAGSVVTKDVPDYALVYGNPAALKGWMCVCGVKLNFKNSKACCKACGCRYKKNKGGVEKI